MLEEPLYVVATAVDPRYRMRLFSAEQQEKVLSLLIAAVQHQSETSDVASPTAKRPRLDNSPQVGVDNVLDELLGVSADQPSSPAHPPTGDVSEQVHAVHAATEHSTPTVGDVMVA